MLVVTIICVVVVAIALILVIIQALEAPTCPKCGGPVIRYERVHMSQRYRCLNCRTYWWHHQIKGR